MVDAFVEAHYYPDGIEHQHFPRSMPRPLWAPPNDRVGLRNEFPVVGNACAVEWCRLMTASGDMVTWLALYRPAVDARDGNRENHAGIGVWLRGPVEFNATDILKSLKNLLEKTKLADGQLSAEDDDVFLKFIDWLNKKIFLDTDFWGGLNHGSGEVRQSKNWQIKTFDQALDNIGHHIGALSHSFKVLKEDRYLYAITSDTQPDFDALLSVDMTDMAFFKDVTNHVAKVCRERDLNSGRCVELEARETGLKSQIATAHERIASLEGHASVLQTTLAAYKQDPNEIMFQTRDQILLHLTGLERRIDALGDKAAVKEIFAKLDSIQSAISKLEKSQSLPSTPAVFQGRPTVSTYSPVQRQPALPPEQGVRWSNAEKGILVVFVIVVIIIVAALALAWKFWQNSPAVPVDPPLEASAYPYSLSTPEQRTAELAKSRNLVDSYRTPAETGDVRAQEKLGLAYYQGQGVAQDYVQAYKWFSLVVANAADAETRDNATKNRDIVAAKMQPAQIAEAQRLASEWRKK